MIWKRPASGNIPHRPSETLFPLITHAVVDGVLVPIVRVSPDRDWDRDWEAARRLLLGRT